MRCIWVEDDDWEYLVNRKTHEKARNIRVVVHQVILEVKKSEL
jgi:hypothetical protein